MAVNLVQYKFPSEEYDTLCLANANISCQDSVVRWFKKKKKPIIVISFLIYQEVGFEIAFVNFKGSSSGFSFFLLFVIFGKGKETKQPTKEYLSSTFGKFHDNVNVFVTVIHLYLRSKCQDAA